MRKMIKRRTSVLTAKIAELETMLMSDMTGQPISLWLQIRQSLIDAIAQLNALHNKK
jgi:hypothetical protein